MTLMGLRLLLVTTLVLTACGSVSVSCADAGTKVTYANFGAEFMRVYCVACHGGQRVEKRVDLTTAAGVAAHARNVISSAGVGTSMPPSGPMPTDAERAMLTEWVSCGAP